MKLVFVAAVACAVCMIGCGSDSDSVATSAATTRSAPTATTSGAADVTCTPAVPTGNLAIAKSASAKSAGGGTISVRRLEQKASLRPAHTKSPAKVENLRSDGSFVPDGRFVVVPFEFHNSGPEPMKASTAVEQSMVLVSSGKSYAAADGAPGCAGISTAFAKTSSQDLTNSAEAIEPGASYKTAVVYVIPAGSGPLTWYAPKLKLKSALTSAKSK